MPNKTPVFVTLGEPGGIGPELVLKLWKARETNRVKPFVFVATEEFIRSRSARLGCNIQTTSWHLDDWKKRSIDNVFARALPVFELESIVTDETGQLLEQNSHAVIDAIRTSVTAIKNGHSSAIVTNPINKKALYDVGFEHPGHTEFLGELSKEFDVSRSTPVMMLAGPELRTVPATLHIPLADVPSKLTEDDLLQTIIITNRDLIKRFGIAKPRIVVAGLNPHAGENGTMGTEDDTIIVPAIKRAQAKEIDVSGPFPGDTLFYKVRRKTYDVAIAMYHDQALIPVKTIAFDETVNVTLGLPFIRTSPDHGTALDIAGQGIARPDSLLAAINLAHELAGNSSETEIH